MPCVDNWSTKPLEMVKNIFENRTVDDDWIKQVINYFSNRLKSRSALNMIPSLNVTQSHDLRSGILVRFRCMVQETFEPEFYAEKYEVSLRASGDKVVIPGAFTDAKEYDEDMQCLITEKMATRQLLYCVVIPAETDWVKEKYELNKRSSAACSQPIEEPPANVGKRSLEQDEEAMEEDVQPTRNGVDHSKRQKQNANGENQSIVSPLKKNHPLPNEKGPVCIVRVYHKEDFKINEIYEFVGILSMDSSLEYVPVENAADPETNEELRAHNPPPSYAPRLHCVHMIKLGHNNPLLWNNDKLASDFPRLTIKNELLNFLKLATFGDELVAEYLLMHLTSRVYSRTGTMAVGKFSLNITNISNGSKYPMYLTQLLKQLLTKVFYFPMTLTNLNKTSFIPTKNYSTNRLDSGVLQLSKGTHIIMDETVLQPGQLDSNGVKHMQAVCSLLNFQKVDYDFQYYPLSFEHDVPVLVVSDGKSLLPCDFQISLSPTTPVPDDLSEHFAQLNLSPELLDKFRVYLTLAKSDDYELHEDMMKVIENDFVAARQVRSEKMTADDLHLHLIVARMLSINAGFKTLSMDTWKKVKMLEANRKHRIGQR